MSGTAHPMRRMFLAIIGAFVVLLGMGLWRVFTGPGEEEFSGEAQGSTYSIKIATPQFGEARRKIVQKTITDRLDQIDRGMSIYRDDSELARFNRWESLEPFAASADLIEVFKLARSVSETSGGAFDVTVAPLVAAWDFGPAATGEAKSPSEAALAEIKSRVGYDKVEVDEKKGTLRKTVGGVTCDLNAIAQGYTVDKIVDDLVTLGYRDFVVEVGGEVRAMGRNRSGIPWQVAVEKPVFEGREIEEVIPLNDMGLSTSGDYRNYKEKDGLRISHEIDPHTGRPIMHHLASVSVLHPQCALADAYATALIVLGPEKGFDLAVSKGLAALFITSEQDAGFAPRATPAFEKVAGRGNKGSL